ncbi:MAG: AmmeMemoRadiSam system protein A [Candidatus Izemoplasma sp.]|nr:AmmeMemoRadiSam system protein A [Candidatus Izemoplasma sp.]
MSILAGYVVPHPPIIVDDVGSEDTSAAKKTIEAYHQVAKDIQRLKPDTIIVSSPHGKLYRDYFHVSSGIGTRGDFGQFGAKDVSFAVSYDTKLVKEISDQAHHNNLPVGTLGGHETGLDHGVMVPLYFINQYYQDYQLIRISPSGFDLLEHYKIGKFIQSIVANDKKVVWVASGDLSHKLKESGPYGFIEEGPKLDHHITDVLKTAQFNAFFDIPKSIREKGAECGLSSFVMMAGALDRRDIDHTFLSYEGPFGVGYAVSMYHVLGIDQSKQYDKIYQTKASKTITEQKTKEDPYIQLARASLEYFTKYKKRLILPTHLPKELLETKASVFVTIFKHGELRGCVGKTSPTYESVAEEIIDSAISAGHHDHRFPHVKEDELPYLTYKVDVLSPPETIDSIDQLDVKTYGVIVKHGYRSGLLLPNLDGIDTAEKQVSIAKQKAGINPNEPVDLERFKVVRHEVS